VQPRWLIGAFLALASAVREENALMSYGFLFPKSLRRCRRLVFAFLFLPALYDIPCRCAGMIACRHNGIQAGIVLPFPQRI